MKTNHNTYGNRWIAYFDILGFKKLVKQHSKNIDSFTDIVYSSIIEEIITRSGVISKNLNKLECAWFSDSFIIFTNDDTFASYSAIDIFSWEFFQKMTFSKHLLRGALSVGELYTDKKRNTYIGPALIKAYESAESQEWIGLVLTPEAQNKLSEPDYAIDTTRYLEYPVPTKSGERQLFARKIDSLKKDIIQAQQSAMHEKKYKDKLKAKYDNTLKFIEHCQSP